MLQQFRRKRTEERRSTVGLEDVIKFRLTNALLIIASLKDITTIVLSKHLTLLQF